MTDDKARAVRDPRYSALLRIDGGIGQTLIVGATYRVGEIRTHLDPTGVQGEPDHETTVIRFDPVPTPEPSPAFRPRREQIDTKANRLHRETRQKQVKAGRKPLTARERLAAHPEEETRE